MLKYSDVFVPGGFPRHTYNPRDSWKIEDQISEVKSNLCKLVTVTGHTKSGKTVLTRKVLPLNESVWVDGGMVDAEDDLWTSVLEQLDAYTEHHSASESGSSSTISGKGTASANFIVAKGEGEVGAEHERNRSTSAGRARKVSNRVAALTALREANVPLVIDDFHYLPKNLQGGIVRALKPLVFDGVPVVLIAIPHRRYDAVRVEREMTGRMLPMTIPTWDEKELSFIPTKGFPLLGIKVPDSIAALISKEAIGSPHLMQEFCRGIARHIAQSKTKELALDFDPSPIYREVANTIGRPIFEKLAKGPRQRSDRVKRTLKSGGEADIYQLVIHALAHLKPDLVTLEYEDLRAAIREVISGNIPQLHEVARVLKHMATIASTDQSSTPVIDFDESDKKLHITDPFFAFYLRWGDVSST
ncbi:hypothetical protein [Luteimonas deserti]|uniref:Uncharacterized protein n=1 Tax=Luteimonas deserti TaxID=2752306 RepID=A0A7Z0QMM9_9GAMM|nr:hypothetical protein [Luteimonas deserti]NYZ61451.1 hypothetical protein [Luteimonas deserti]